MKSLNCKKQTKKCISLLSAGALLLSTLAGSFSVSAADAVINVKDYSSLATDDNWTPAIQKAIDTAAETGATVYIPSGEYPCEPAEEKESWEVTPATFYLPDAAVTIMGDGEETVLYKPRNASITENSAAMFRTSYKSSAKITIKNIKIRGNNNPGSNFGLIDGIVLNGSSNATVENVSVDGTKRHGIYMIAGANNNKIVNPVISNTNREMLGCGLQLEGAYNNTVINPVITSSGANAVDLSLWVPGGIYPANDGSNGSPYSSSDDYRSTGNVITGGMIAGTGIDNGNIGGGAFENNANDDDYYGLNIIKGSNGNKISLDLIRDVRTADNYNSKAAAIRLYDVENNEINVKQVYNTKQYVLSFRNTCQNNSVTVGAACKIGASAANNETYYESNTVSITEEEFEAPGNVIRAKLNFTNGEDGVKKESNIALYSLHFACCPERFGLFKDGSNITAIAGSDWKLEYDYALSDKVVGMGNIQVQGGSNWNCAGNPAADRTDGTGKWQKAQISLEPLGCSATWSQSLYCLTLSTSTTAAVDTNKTYYAYYKNVRIVDGEGNVKYTFTDSDLTPAELNPQVWGSQTNLNTTLDTVLDPYFYADEDVPTADKVIRAAVKFTNGDEGVEKESKVALYSLRFACSPERFGLFKDGSNITSIAGSDWNLEYEYALSDKVVGMGNIQVQGGSNWNCAGDPSADRTDGTGKWQKAQISLEPLGCSTTWSQSLYCLALSSSTTAAVDTNKTYYTYYKNIRIVDGEGNVKYTFTDNDLTTSELQQQAWGDQKNMDTTLSVVSDPYFTPVKEDKIIQAAVKFTNGEDGVKKESNIALYSLWLAYSPERFGLFKDGSNITSIAGSDWKLEYDYALSDTVIGMGNIQVQGGSNWNCAGDPAADRTDGAFAWKKAAISLAPLGCSATWSQPLYCLALSTSTTAAVDTNKTYYAYYTNIRIVDGSGDVMYSFTDGDLTAEELNPQVWNGEQNAQTTLSVVDGVHAVTAECGGNGTAEVGCMTAAGSEKTFITKPDTSYRVENVTADGAQIVKNSRNSYSFSMPNTEVKLNITFAAITKGDINEDGQLGSADVASLKKIILGSYGELDEYESFAARVRGADEIDIRDLIALKKACA